jgi:hypothetical protein
MNPSVTTLLADSAVCLTTAFKQYLTPPKTEEQVVISSSDTVEKDVVVQHKKCSCGGH